VVGGRAWYNSVSAQQDAGASAEGWPRPYQPWREEEGWRLRGGQAGVGEQRGTETGRLITSAKCRGHPGLLKKHVTTLPHLKAVLSMLR